MGAVSTALADAASAAGTEIVTSAGVSAIRGGDDGAEVTWQDATGGHTTSARFVLSNVAPWVLQILLGSPDGTASKPQGAQLKINLLLDRLPQLRSGINPRVAFAGTLHVAQGYAQLEAAYADAAAGRLPSVLPGEVYCHSLTDPSVLGDLAEQGAQTLTYFGLHTPASVFEASPQATKEEAVRRALAAIDEYLVESIANCVSTDANGNPCIEARTPQELEADLAMPGGHIYHGDVEWPWSSNRARLDTPAQQWGVQTHVPSVLVCGSGARRGGGVSGIGGHNAAQAVLASL
jgi:phytoene dehydrogenase-like protein